jgi:IQ and AAA domain-containing protein
VALPLGSQTLRAGVSSYMEERNLGKLPKSVCLYGPSGSGKTLLMQGVAAQTGALLFNLSAGNTEGKFTEKGGAAKLLHMVFAVAKEPGMGPSIIYIDECEKLCGNTGKKKSVSEGPARFKKDLPAYINWLEPTDPVSVVGCTSEPWNGDEKALRNVFDRFLFCPLPDYASRRQIWLMSLESRLGSVGAALPEGFDVSVLAHVSSGYSVGSILKTLQAVLTERRMERMSKRRLTEAEFAATLSRCPRVYADVHEQFADFTDRITGYQAARERLAKIALGVDPDAKKGGKGKKK